MMSYVGAEPLYSLLLEVFLKQSNGFKKFQHDFKSFNF